MSDQKFGLDFKHHALDDDFTFTAPSNDRDNERLGKSIRSHYRCNLPGWMNFERDTAEGGEAWNVSLYKIIINNFQQNSCTVRVETVSTGQKRLELSIPPYHYRDRCEVFKEFFDLLEKHPLETETRTGNFRFRARYTHYNKHHTVFSFMDENDQGSDPVCRILRSTRLTLKEIFDLFSRESREYSIFFHIPVKEGFEVSPLTPYFEKTSTFRRGSFQGTLPDYSGEGVRRMQTMDDGDFATDRTFIFSKDLGKLLGLHEFDKIYVQDANLTLTDYEDRYEIHFANSNTYAVLRQEYYDNDYYDSLLSVGKSTLVQFVPEAEYLTFVVADDHVINLVNKDDFVVWSFSGLNTLSKSLFYDGSDYVDRSESRNLSLFLPNLNLEDYTYQSVPKKRKFGENERETRVSSVLEGLIHPMIHLGEDKKIVEFFPEQNRHIKRIAPMKTKTLEVKLRDLENDREPIFWTGVVIPVFKFTKGNQDWQLYRD